MASSTVDIVLDNGSHCFAPGQTIYGNVSIRLEKEIKTTGIKLKIKGKSESEVGVGRFREECKVFHLKDEVYLIGGKDIETKTLTLLKGYTEYPFTFKLPEILPSTFDGSHGFVEYYMTAKIKRPYRFDVTTHLPFAINSNGVPIPMAMGSGINHSQYCQSNYQAATPMQVGPKEISMNREIHRGGTLAFKFKLDRTHYVPGELLQFVVEIFNLSLTRIISSCIRLFKVTHFEVGERGNNETEKILEIIGPIIPAGENRLWKCSGDRQAQPGCKIPSTKFYPNLDGCSIIHIKYNVELKLKSADGEKLRGSIPISIGAAAPLDTYGSEINYYMNPRERSKSLPKCTNVEGANQSLHSFSRSASVKPTAPSFGARRLEFKSEFIDPSDDYKKTPSTKCTQAPPPYNEVMLKTDAAYTGASNLPTSYGEFPNKVLQDEDSDSLKF